MVRLSRAATVLALAGGATAVCALPASAWLTRPIGLTGTALAAPLAPSASASAVSPTTPATRLTRKQIKAAVAAAERSKTLWATVNICQLRTNPTTAQPDTIGIRAQMPSLGFPAWLSMVIQLNYYSTTKKQFVPVPTDGTRTTTPVRSATKLQQGGGTWGFDQPALLNATVQFFWRRAGKLLGETSVTTTAGHPAAAFGIPPHYSAKDCQIP